MTRKRFAREDWLDLALAQLSAHGAEALKLEAMCKAAGLTRGSFYHHFADHAAFLVAVTTHWRTVQTQAVIDDIPPGLPPEDRAVALSDLALALDAKLELGIRELARRHPSIAALVTETDAMRVAFLTDIYIHKFAAAKEEAQMAAQVEYAAFIGTLITLGEAPLAERKALETWFNRVLTRHFSAV